ncbi:peptidoglycan-associated lipoprotein Pal [Donghicola tyrosinivorans]|uniref:Peptidoglycan-associated lipoprotein n=1 Tax=Donghicola tyrosinivorans TaxID=1652492 RepID=A0A2T0WWN5_9RHOB|nr:peptidoglycan-associated lipoprotein Pal [Donghicola tyrosinivorans]PRY91095.1 peptidoglycan-associated lipoprotein [Donghicola tyrosinivorans]
MKHYGKIALIISALALSACAKTNADRFGAEGADGAYGANDAYGANGAYGDPSSVGYFQQAVGDRVLFEVDQSTLTAAAQSTLDAQANWLMTNNDYRAVIEGHADEQGTREYNIALGARRATSVRDYLIAKGLSPARIEIVSYGKERPIAVCSEESCYAQNRRAVTVIAGGLSS